MSLIAEFDITSPKLVLSAALDAVPMVVEIEQEFGGPDGRPIMFFWAEGEDFDGFERAMSSDETVTGVCRLVDVGERVLYRVAVTAATEAITYPMWIDLEAEGLEATYRDGRWRSRMRFPDREALRGYRAWCDDRDIVFELRHLYDTAAPDDALGSKDGVTDRQPEALSLAREQRYFAVPRETSLKALATYLGISEHAVSERLRRGTARLVDTNIGT